jgi:hypothetical protein
LPKNTFITTFFFVNNLLLGIPECNGIQHQKPHKAEAWFFSLLRVFSAIALLPPGGTKGD